jgi:serine phosphatase RsbU (regulator of sigma subunit)
VHVAWRYVWRFRWGSIENGHNASDGVSGGLLFGINAVSGYLVCNFPIVASDRFLLYTDGVTSPENQTGNSLGKAGWNNSSARINLAAYPGRANRFLTYSIK